MIPALNIMLVILIFVLTICGITIFYTDQQKKREQVIQSNFTAEYIIGKKIESPQKRNNYKERYLLILSGTTIDGVNRTVSKETLNFEVDILTFYKNNIGNKFDIIQYLEKGNETNRTTVVKIRK